MASKKIKEKNTYTYLYLNGQSTELEAGKDGVTQELIDYLEASDDEMRLQERYKRENDDPVFQHFLWRYQRSAKIMDSPIDQIPDENMDIFEILFPEEELMPIMRQMLPHVLEKLTDNQRNLIWEAYGLQKGDTEIAREQNVSREAIQNRRKKILRRVEKLLMEAISQKH